MKTKIFTASRLDDGAPVWLNSSRDWSTRYHDPLLFEVEDCDDQAVLDASSLLGLTDVRMIEVNRETRIPTANREKMRISGPSVRRDLRPSALTGRRLSRPTLPLPSESSRSPFAGIFRYDEYDRQFLRDRANKFRGQILRRLSGELSEEEFKPLRLMNGLYLQLHAYMLRVAIPYGVLSASQLRQLAYVARTYDRGYGHFTTRQNIQFNWPRLGEAADILSVLAEADLHAIQTSGNCVRNVTIDHFAGAAGDEILDPRVYAEILRQWSTDHPEFTYLPRKFKIALSGSRVDRAAVRFHDIGILGRLNDQGEAGFEVYAGGGLGRTPIIGTKVREWLPVRDFLRYVEAILRVYNALGRRDNIYKARIKILIKEMKVENFISMIESEFSSMPSDYSVLIDPIIKAFTDRFLTPDYDVRAPIVAQQVDAHVVGHFQHWISTNTHPHRMMGYICAVISLKPEGGISGDISADEMDFMAELADKFSFGELRVSHQQNLVLPHVRQDQLFELWTSLSERGLATANIGLITDTIACPGLDYCGLALARSIPIAQDISKRFADPVRQRQIGQLDLNISGCINACGHHHIANIGLLGADKGGEEIYQITLGGDNGAVTSLGSILGRGLPADKVVDAVEDIVNIYIDERQRGEKFIDTYRRIGSEPFKRVINDRH